MKKKYNTHHIQQLKPSSSAAQNQSLQHTHTVLSHFSEQIQQSTLPRLVSELFHPGKVEQVYQNGTTAQWVLGCQILYKRAWILSQSLQVL